MKKQKLIETDRLEYHCVVFKIQKDNGTKLFEYLKQDSKLTPIYHWVQGECNETEQTAAKSS